MLAKDPRMTLKYENLIFVIKFVIGVTVAQLMRLCQGYEPFGTFATLFTAKLKFSIPQKLVSAKVGS